MPKAKASNVAERDSEALSARALLDEALGRSPSHRSNAATPLPEAATSPGASSAPSVKALSLAPSAGGAAQTWKSRRAKYAHLPPITVTLYRGDARAEVSVDEAARCGDLMRDLLAGGPAGGILDRLGLSTPRSTPRASLGPRSSLACSARQPRRSAAFANSRQQAWSRQVLQDQRQRCNHPHQVAAVPLR